jgi:tetraacyldisaccharide 4'-kinase
MRPHRFFYPLALLFEGVVRLRNWLFDNGWIAVQQAGVPVISVGNITAGGSGKTPMVIEIARILIRAGKRVAVISRGYGRETTGTIVVSDGRSLRADPRTGGDEPNLIATSLPEAIVIADEKRIRAARSAVKNFHAEVIVLDDGFQHRYIGRSLDIVLLDALRSPFETTMLPAGYRRESLQSLRRAQCIIVTNAASESDAEMIYKNAALDGISRRFSAAFRTVAVTKIGESGTKRSPEFLNGQSVVAVSGIANPDRFHREVERLGCRIERMIVFEDHHRYTQNDIADIVAAYRSCGAEIVVTTEKDSVKIKEYDEVLSGVPVFSPVLAPVIHHHNEFETLIKNSAR